MRPLSNNLLVRYALRSAYYDDSTKNLQIPEEQRKTSNEGVVVAAGPGHWEEGVFVPNEVHEGDRVLFSRAVRRSGIVVNVGGKHLRIINEADVAAVLEVGRSHVCPTCNGQGVVTKAVVDEGSWAMEGGDQ